jgi:hypothetical protein
MKKWIMKKFLTSIILCGILATVASAAPRGFYYGRVPQVLPQPSHRVIVVVPRYKTQKVTEYRFAPPWAPSRPTSKTTTTYYRQSGVSAVIIINPYCTKD